MIIIRAACEKDLEPLWQLADQGGIGLTTLARDRSILSHKIRRSIDSFSQATMPAKNGYYLFVIEDTENNKVVGCSAIDACVDGQWPFYSYKINRFTKVSQQLNKRLDFEILQMVNDFQDATELCTLFLLRDYRKNNNGKALSLSRFMFMGLHKQRFGETIFAEMRGVSDEYGRSPFWEALGKHFFDIDFSEADYLSGVGKKQFIADLMPPYPVYTNLLPAEAQAVIAKPHHETVPAIKLLKNQGLHYRGYIDIFDGGPCLDARLQNIKSIREQKKSIIKKIDNNTTQQVLFCTTDLNFYAAVININIFNKTEVSIDERTAEQFNLKVGDEIAYLDLGA